MKTFGLSQPLGGGFHVTQLPGVATPESVPDEEADS